MMHQQFQPMCLRAFVQNHIYLLLATQVFSNTMQSFYFKDTSFKISFTVHLKRGDGENGSGIKVTEEDVGGGEKEKKSSWAGD